MRLAWATDIHLNFLDDEELQTFLEQLAGESWDALAVSGDIGESGSVVGYLEMLATALARPIYFVLGNHDYYLGSIGQTRRAVAASARQTEHLCYLSQAEFVSLTPSVALVGHDGWWDARLGNFDRSPVIVSDLKVIDELKKWKKGPDHLAGLKLDRPIEQDLLKWKLVADDLDRDAVEPVVHALGDEAAEHFAKLLPKAFEKHEQVIAVTHVPPFREAARYRGRPTGDDHLPFYTCKAVGDVMIEVMEARPDRELLVLCGHTHGQSQARILGNLRVLTGPAEYMEPTVQEVFDFSDVS